jgi:hypothetical protein
MRVGKFARDIDAELKVMGVPLHAFFGTEREGAVIVTDDVAVFEHARAGDRWTGDYVAPGGTAPPALTRLVGIDIEVRGIARVAGAGRDDHCDYVGALTESLMCAIERLRKRRHWAVEYGTGEMDRPAPGDQPEQGARYTLTIHIGVPVQDKDWPSVDGSTLGVSGVTKAMTLDGTDFDVVCGSP